MLARPLRKMPPTASTTASNSDDEWRLKVRALDDIWAFADLIDFHGGSERFSEIHRELAAFITRPQMQPGNPDERRRVTLIPRGHLKSTINSLLYVLWRLYRNPNLRILYGTNTKKLSKSFIRQLRAYFENVDLQRRVWNTRPHIEGRMIPRLHGVSRRNNFNADTESVDTKVVWNADALQLVRTHIVKEPSVFASSVGMQLTGDHYDILILDDIVDFDNSSTPDKAETIYDWAQDLESVLTRKASWQSIADDFGEFVGDEVIINGTTYYNHDYYSTLFLGVNKEETERKLREIGYVMFHRNIFKNGVDETDGYIYPEEFDDAVIARLKKQLKPRRFAAQYLLQVIADNAVSLDYSKIRFVQDEAIEILGYNLIKINNKYISIRLVTDIAVAQHQKADFCCFGVGGYDDEGTLYLVDMVTARMKPMEFVNRVYHLVDKWLLSAVTIEKHAQQEAFKWLLIDESKKPGRRTLFIREMSHTENKALRIEFHVQPLLEAGRLVTTRLVAAHNPLEEQMMLFGSSNVKDDSVDVLACLAETCIRTPQTIGTEKRRNVGRHVQYNTKYGGIH